MIDEKKLIESLRSSLNTGRETFPLDMIIDCIEEQPKVGEWIPCSERLPEESLNSVIGWDEYRERRCFVQYYGEKWHIGSDVEPVKIVAWMPLPEPYRPEKESEKIE